jgi:hypothetical protein
MKTDDAIKLLEKQGFDVYIQDSVFYGHGQKRCGFKTIARPKCHRKNKPYRFYNR